MNAQAPTLEASGIEHNIDKFKASVELLAKMLSEHHNIDVIFEGTTCATDGKMIILPDPSLLEMRSMDAEKREHALGMLRALQGFVNHEAAHVLFTRTQDKETLANDPEYGKFGAAVMNVVEDVRIEKHMARRWANAAHFLDSKNEWAWSDHDKNKESDPVSPVGQLLLSILWASRHGIDSKEAKTFGDDIHGVLRILEPEIKQVANAETQDDAFEAAKVLTKRLKEIIPPEQQKDPDEEEEDEQGGGGGSGDDEDEEGEGDGDAQGDEDGDAGDEGSGGAEDGEDQDGNPSSGRGKSRGKSKDKGRGGDGDGDDDDSDGEDGERSSPRGKPRANRPRDNGRDGKRGARDKRDGNDGDPDRDGSKPRGQKPRTNKPGRTLKGIHDTDEVQRGDDDAQTARLIEKIFQTIDPSKVVRKYRVYSTREDDVGMQEHDATLLPYARVLDRARRDVGVVKRGVQAYLMAQQEAVWVGDRERGKLDNTALYKLVQRTGTHVFKEKQRAKTFKGLGIELLINLSGSMSSIVGGTVTRLEMAKYVAVIFGEVLDSLGVPFEIHGHSADYRGNSYAAFTQASPNVRPLYARWASLVFKTIKRFDEPYKACRSRVSSMRTIGNTFDGEAIEVAAKRLANNGKVERRIIISLDDGIPEPTQIEYNAGKIQDHRLNLRTQVQRAEKAGIEVIGVGMGVDEVRHYYSKTIVIHDERQTAAILTKDLRKLLMQSR